MKLLKQYLLLTLVLTYFSCSQEPVPNKMTKAERIAEMAAMEIEMTKDPATGLVPKETLYEIRQQLIKDGKYDPSREGEEWIKRGPNNVGGRTRAVLIDSRDPSGNTLLVGSVAGGLWKMVDADTNPIYEPVEGYTGNPSIGSIVQDPNNPEEMYIGTGEGWFNGDAYSGDGIYKSSNSGVDWDRLPSTSNGNFDHTQKLLFTQDGNLLAATRESGIQMSIDGGQSWAPVLNNANQGFSNRAADIEITADGTIFAAMGIQNLDGIYRSDDGGFQWTFMDININEYRRIELGTSPTDPNIVMALIQEPEGAVSHILRSTDKGETWTQKTVALTFNGENFARNQAWYDLSIAIDPNNSDIAFIGGINLYKTTNGGDSWDQLSEWFDTPAIQNVHADQHFATYVNGSSDRMMFSNDGGLYITQDATSDLPDIRSISVGYVSTQFYACAIHPEAGRDFFLAGAQDNGTNQLTNPGLGPATSPIGGDGAFCHIGQNNANFQVGASQRGGFVATFGGDLSTGGFYPQEGAAFFINPTELDDINLVVYASQNAGRVYRTQLVSGDSESIPLNALANERVSALKMDPHDDSILYLGTAGGRIIKVTDPNSEAPTSELLFAGNGFTRNIEVDHLDQNKLLVTYSNFGVESIFTSNDRGESWRSIEGDLPNIPVRWGIFNPRNSDQVLIATEVGIWQADISQQSVSWENVSPQIGLARVDMLKFRSSDLEVLAASYGKGLWTSSSFSAPGLKFFNESVSIDPRGIFNDDFCDPIETRAITVGTAAAYDIDVEFSISIDPSSTAVEGLDFELNTTSGILSAGEKSVEIDLAVFDNATIDSDKTLNLILDSDQELLGNMMQIDILDNDAEFKTEGTNLQTFIGDGDEIDNSVFNGAWGNARTQILYTSEYLAEFGVTGQIINRLVFDVDDNLSEIPYDNFTISMALVTNDTLSHLGYIEDAGLINVFQENVDVKSGVNVLALDDPFLYDGVSNLLLEICYDNDETSDSDFIFGTSTDYISALRTFSDDESGCATEGQLEVLKQVPNIRFRSGIPVGVFNQSERIFSSSIEPDLTAYFASNDSIMCSVTNESMTDDICFSTELAETSGEVITEDQMLWINRIYDMTSDSDEDQSITIHYSTIGSDIWFDEDIEGLYQTSYGAGVPIEWSSVELINTEIRDDYIAFTMPYQGDGFYTVGQEFYPLPNNDIEIDITYDQIRIFDLLGRVISDKDKLDYDVPTGIYIKTYLNSGKVVKSEKIFME